MLEYSPNSTEIYVLNFASSLIIKVPSSSTSNLKEFPGVSEETLRYFILKQKGFINTEEADDTSLSEQLVKNLDANKIFLTRIETVPLNMSDASQKHESKKWQAAVELELKRLQNFKAYKIFKIPTEHQVVATRFLLTKEFSENINSERYKARLIVRNFEFKTNFSDAFAAIPYLDILLLVIYYCAPRATSIFSLYSVNFVSAFLNATSDPHLYITTPQGIEIRDGYCWKLHRALYGTARAPRLWHKILENLYAASDSYAQLQMPACTTEKRKK